MKILGAGLAGLIAGNLLPQSELYEARSREDISHKALLRFRSSQIGDRLGIEFKRVLVRKGIWHRNRFVQPNIEVANRYAMKVVGRLESRSIWDIEPVERFIAPEDFTEQLIYRLNGRIEFNHNITEIPAHWRPVISTLPMPTMARIVGEQIERAPEFRHQPIHVRRYRVLGASVHQTVYYADQDLPVYRASITGDLLIVEGIINDAGVWLSDVLEPFGLSKSSVTEIETAEQRYGKISPIEDAWRKRFIFSLSQNFGIYSLGRFATWRNLLLDDLINDINVIKKLILSNSYEIMKKSL